LRLSTKNVPTAKTEARFSAAGNLATLALEEVAVSAEKVVVLGAGRVGRAIAYDLQSSGFAVTAVDPDPRHFPWLARYGAATCQADATDPQVLAPLVAEARWVVNAVPGFAGFSVLQNLVRLGKEVVDISFMPEDPRALDPLAKEKRVRVAVDCGVAPGLSHLLLGAWYAASRRLDRFVCYVGGLPKERVLPWEYKAPFSPVDVLEEYTRPARLRRGGAVVTLPAMSEPELVEVPGVGSLEAFLTDGLRTALDSIPVPSMEEKTLRYPGYRDKILLLLHSGLLSRKPLRVGGGEVVPLEVTAKALEEAWFLAEGEADITVLELFGEGVFADGSTRRRFSLLDAYDPATGLSSMARTTGFTATAVLRALHRGLWQEPGVLLPELLGQKRQLLEAVLTDLADRGIRGREEP
jgi:lysine 6-dehydrogenase